jgi:hypothetical protein
LVVRRVRLLLPWRAETWDAEALLTRKALGLEGAERVVKRNETERNGEAEATDHHHLIPPPTTPPRGWTRGPGGLG